MNGKHARRRTQYAMGLAGFGKALRRGGSSLRIWDCRIREARRYRPAGSVRRTTEDGRRHVRHGTRATGQEPRAAPNKANPLRFWAENPGRAKKQSQSKPIPGTTARLVRDDAGPVRRDPGGERKVEHPEEGKTGEQGFEPRPTYPESASNPPLGLKNPAFHQMHVEVLIETRIWPSIRDMTPAAPVRRSR
jgi:hypothetical protein